jgi:hypothetical protein
MPFTEITKGSSAPKNRCVLYTNGSLNLDKTLFKEHTDKTKVKLFIDTKTKLLGLQPSDEGYSVYTYVSSNATVGLKARCLLKTLGLGYHYIKWSSKHMMFIISLEKVT